MPEITDIHTTSNLFFWINLAPLRYERALYIIANLSVWLAYILIPVAIVFYISKQAKHVHFGFLYKLFAVFLFAGSTIFLLDIFSLWSRNHILDICLRVSVSVISWLTLLYMIRVLPAAFALRSPKDMEEEIARRIKAENTLTQNNTRLLEAEKTAKLGYGYWDVVRNRIELSDIAFDVLGLPTGAILSLEMLMEQVHPADLKFVQEALRKNLNAKEFHEFYFRIITPSMQVKHLLVKGENVKNEINETIMVKVILQDVSEIRRYMKRIELQNKKLKKIAWVQSHRMRGPVATIIGMAELINENDPADPINFEVIRSIKSQSMKLDDMILEVENLTREKLK
ncbi:MAG TPA: PAS domain-containing protein [Flavipsychrobacter sp.]|nr:PAS domain-containing protein [Flavipsychrobacter sp.]